MEEKTELSPQRGAKRCENAGLAPIGARVEQGGARGGLIGVPVLTVTIVSVAGPVTLPPLGYCTAAKAKPSGEHAGAR